MKIKYSILFIVALVFTGFAVFNSYTTYRTAERSSEHLLNSTAYYIVITLQEVLLRTGIDEELFHDVIRSQPWDDISFIALYDEDGKTLLHSKPGLIGTSLGDQAIRESMHGGDPTSYFRTVREGGKEYVMDMPVRIKNGPDRKLALLRVALHTESAEEEMRHAKVHAVTALIIICFLWILSIAIVRYSNRVISLHMKDVEKRHFVMLGEMAAVLAHEIRSPLSAIKGFAQFISEKKENTASEEEGLDVIISESQRLERLTEDLLVYARSSSVNPEQFSLPELLDEVERLCVLDKSSCTIIKNINLKNNIMHTDREKLKQILINVLKNAMDATENSGPVQIDVSDHTHVVNIIIRDSGKGMDTETLNNALRPFFTTKAKGTGLGLAIVDNLVRILNGSLSIESEQGKKTEVIMSVQRNLK